MEKAPKYFIVDSSALPEIFRKVAEAKRMLETGETDKVNVATKAVGISRSAFYKRLHLPVPEYDGRTHYYLPDGSEGQGWCSVLDIIHFCQLRRKYTDHQPVHSDRR